MKPLFSCGAHGVALGICLAFVGASANASITEQCYKVTTYWESYESSQSDSSYARLPRITTSQKTQCSYSGSNDATDNSNNTENGVSGGGSSGVVAKDKSSTQAGGDNAAGNIDGCSAGNPVMIASGNKVEIETDMVMPGPYPLILQRIYNRNSIVTGLFGERWSTPFDRRAALGGYLNPTTPGTIMLFRSDGSMLRFNYDAASDSWPFKAETNLPASQLQRITRVAVNPLRFRFVDGSGNVEIYASGGSMLSTVDVNGVG